MHFAQFIFFGLLAVGFGGMLLLDRLLRRISARLGLALGPLETQSRRGPTGYKEWLRFIRGYAGTLALFFIFFKSNYVLAHGALVVMLVWLSLAIYKRRVKPVVVGGATRVDMTGLFSALALNIVPWFFALHVLLTDRYVSV